MGLPVIPQYTPEAASPTGALVFNFVGEAVLAAGDSVPADGLGGYGEGCIFYKNSGAADAQVYINQGTGASCNFDAMATTPLTGLTASPAELNVLDGQGLTVGAGAGITGGTGTVYWNRITKDNGNFETTIFIDLTGLASSTTDLDIIGTGTSAAYIAKLAATETGATIDAVEMRCLEAPAGGVTDIDLYSASEATGKFDDAVTGLTETALLTAGGAWTNGTTKGATVCPTAAEYLYLTGGAGGTAATYTAGKFVIKIYGH